MAVIIHKFSKICYIILFKFLFILIHFFKTKIWTTMEYFSDFAPGGHWKIIWISAHKPSLSRLGQMQQYMFGFCMYEYTCIWPRIQTYTVASAPAVTGSVFMQSFRLLLGQCCRFCLPNISPKVERFSINRLSFYSNTYL